MDTCVWGPSLRLKIIVIVLKHSELAGPCHFRAEVKPSPTSFPKVPQGLQVLSSKKLLPELPGLKKRLDSGGSILEVWLRYGSASHLILPDERSLRPIVLCLDIDPTGMKTAIETVESAGVQDRVTLIEADIASAVVESSIDAVVMIEVLHEIEPQYRQNVIDGCYRALTEKGWLLIIDETYPSTLAESLMKEFLFPVQTGFEELTWGNIVPVREEQESLLRNAGFEGEIGRSLVGEGFTVLSAQKKSLNS